MRVLQKEENPMVNKAVPVAVATFLSLAMASEVNATPTTLNVVQATSNNSKSFVPCSNEVGGVVPNNNFQGQQYGPGISENITISLREVINSGLVESGRSEISGAAVSLRYTDGGEILVLDKYGQKISEIGNRENPSIQLRAKIPQEAKDIIEACLGFGVFSGSLAEEIARAVSSVKTAIKFVIRRIGFGAAVGCVGGIIWHYI